MKDGPIFLLEVEEEIRRRQREKDQDEYQRTKLERESWEETIQKGRDFLWQFCQLKAPRHYSPNKLYLKNFIDTLQAFYERRIIKFSPDEDWQIVDFPTEGMTGFIVCKKLMINIPPRHGKSRGLIDFCQWILGRNQEERIIECSYNEDAAGDFAKYTRDGIQESKNNSSGYVFSDFFPDVKIKYGSHSYYKWALEGQFFNYLGAGIGGSVTGKGGSVLIIDDIIKLAEEAFNEDLLQKIWNWYTGTFLSRGDAEGGEPLEIITMTRWANQDLCGRILESDEAKDWYLFKLEAYNKETGEMLCEEVLSKKRYDELYKKMVNEIFLANYHNETVDQKGRLYQSFKTYEKLPMDKDNKILIEQRKNYTDTADEGDDYLCSINYGVYQGEAYLLDVLYTKDGMEITEPQTAKFLFDSQINVADIESNNGGSGFARAVRKILQTEKDEKGKLIYESNRTIIYWFHQSENKRARIMSQSAFVQNHIYFPVNWKDRWPEFYKAMTTFMKEGKNKHDDAEDCITGVAEHCKARLIKSGNNIL